MQFNNPTSEKSNKNMTTPHLRKSIGRSPSRLALLLIALVFACLGIRQSAQAGYIVTLQQVGPNVVATGSGAINLHGLTFSRSGSANPGLRPHALGVLGRRGYTHGADFFQRRLLLRGQWTDEFRRLSLLNVCQQWQWRHGRDSRGFWGDVHIIVPTGYVSGSALSDSATYSGRTLARRNTGHLRMDVGNRSEQELHASDPLTPPPPPVTGPPVAITNPATLIASFSAKLNGSVNPHGLTTSVYFQYGTTNDYGLTTAPQSHTGNTSLNISSNTSGLTASTTYHFRIVTTNSAGTRYGSDRTFTTLPPTGFPIVTTKPATNVATSSATLHGLLDPHGLTTTVYFQYGTTTSYGRATPAASHWKHLPEYYCEHPWPSCEHHVSFPNRSYQQCRHQVRQRHDLYHAVAAAFHNQPSRFTVWRLFVSRALTLTTL